MKMMPDPSLLGLAGIMHGCMRLQVTVSIHMHYYHAAYWVPCMEKKLTLSSIDFSAGVPT